jgi:hypothetical protein
MNRIALLLLLCAPAAQAQLVHRGVGREGRVTEQVSFVDAWEDGGGGPDADGTQDVLARREVTGDRGATASVHLLLFGPWGHHLYAYDEDRIRPGVPDSSHLRTTRRAIDLDGDGKKEIVLLERSITTRIALDDTGRPEDEPGPFFADGSVAIRWLGREEGALVEHDLEAEASSDAMKELLQAELGGPLNAWLQLAAADVDFLKERYEQARYRYGVVREWAESQLTAKEIRELSPRLPMTGATPDDPASLWLAATRRIGALPRWYQRR